MFTELLYSSSNWLYSSAMLLRVVVPVSSILYLSLRNMHRTFLVRCDVGLVISSDSSKTRHSFLEARFMKRLRPLLSLRSMEVETTRNIPSGTLSRSPSVRMVRNCSRFAARNGIQVMLTAMAGARMTAFLALRNLSRYFAR